MKKRTKFDKNEIIIYNNYAEIILYNDKNIEIARSIINIDDIEKINKIKWHLSNTGYAITSLPERKSKFLHNFILNRIPNKQNCVDHINRNRLDNRKNNLRIVTPQNNSINKGKQSNNTSGHVGVSFDKSRNKYAPHIKLHRKKIFLGRYDTIEEAIEIRKNAELQYFGEIINRDFDKNTVYKKGKKNYEFQNIHRISK